jgi:hypothetical protein
MRFFKPAAIERWVVVVYERRQRFGEQPAKEMINGLANCCEQVGEFSCLSRGSVGASRTLLQVSQSEIGIPSFVMKMDKEIYQKCVLF